MWAEQMGIAILAAVLLKLQLGQVAAIQLQSCIAGFVVHKDKIIRTEDSLKLGAMYLSEYEVNSRIECINWCCETDNCDVFVYEDKKPGGCYLFHCGPPHDFKCKFTNHANYSSAVLTNYNLLQSADAIDELKSLRKSEPAVSHVQPATSTSTTTTTTSTTTTTTTTTPNPPTSSSSQALKLAGCSRNQFECRSSDDCIAIYNVCDGIPQCADGSDEALELGCPQERTTMPPPPPPPPPQPQHLHPHQHQAQPVLPDLIGYQQMIQHQQYPMRLYPPPEGPAASNQENVNGWANYQPRGYANPAQQQQRQPPNEPPTINEAPVAQQHHLLQPPVNYNQWPGAPANGPWPVNLDEQNLAVAHANHPNAFQSPISNNYPPQQQMPHIFNHKPAGVRLEELESANGLYGGQDPNRNYAPYYPAVIRHPESSWQEASSDNLAPSREGQQQQQSIIRVPLATAAPQRENVPYQQPKLEQQQQHSTTSSTPPPCDSSENRQSDTHDQVQMQHPKTSEAIASKTSAEHTISKPTDHKAHELELKTVAQAHLQEHKSITIVDHLGRTHVSSRIEELELSRPKGAVISLALGLSVTAIMAVLIACRLRVVKRRGRGRSHDSYAHDTDYLVNGMYL